MVFVIRDPILTYFNSLSTSFHGFGINLNLISDGEVSKGFDSVTTSRKLPFKFAKVLVGTQDPTLGALNNTNLTDIDTIYSTASFSTDGSSITTGLSTAETFFTELKNTKVKGIYSFIPPQSWLDIDGYLSSELALSSYANYIVSGILWIRSFGIAADMIELFPFPQSEETIPIVLTPRIHPEDLVILANRVR